MTIRTFNRTIAVSLISLAALLRVLPHPPNFAPVAAVALFAGAVLPRRLGVIIPLLAMVASDAIIGFHSLILVTWGCYAVIALASHYWLQQRTVWRIAFATVGASLFYFIVTNYAVWQFEDMYSHSMSGLIRCFTLALPFLRNTLLSDLLFSASLFGLYTLAHKSGQQFFGLPEVQDNASTKGAFR